MARAALTAKTCAAAAPGLLPDPTAPGLYLRVGARARMWVFRYRERGKSRQLSLGRFPQVSPADARELAALRRAEVVQHRDPVAELRTCTVAAVSADYKATHASRVHGRAVEEDTELVARLDLIVAAFGPRPIGDVTRADIAGFLERWRGKPAGSNKMRGTGRLLWRHAVRSELAPASLRNPWQLIAPAREQPREKVILDAEQLSAVVLHAGRWPNPTTALCLQVIALTGCRPAEAMHLRWSDVDLERGTVTWRERKAGDSMTLPLRPELVAVLKLHAIGRDGPWVFPATRGGGPITDVGKKPWAWVRKTADLPARTTLYDLRSSIASLVAASAGLEVARRLLGHANVRTTSTHYIRASEDAIRAGLDAVADAVGAAMRKSR